MRTAIITGASSGLGRECARALLRSDPSLHVVLAVRDTGRGAEAVKQLGHPQRCTVMPMDLASLASVRAFVDDVRASALPAAARDRVQRGVSSGVGTEHTQDGVEMTFGVNHLGHFALVQGLLDHADAPGTNPGCQQRNPRSEQAHRMPDPRYTSAADLAHPGESAEENGRRRYTTSNCAMCSSATNSTEGSAMV
jgi:NAD(P)-dependent dehydrogenase (short-subunit alcohol dehydrogenase family)